jgi:peptidoglycan hydrolase-like protein with peptidoglycan-binding domain
MRWLITYTRLEAVGLIVAMLAALAALAPGATAAGLGSAQRAQSVRDAQTRLAELRFMPTSQVDGRLGPRTKDAITAFQQWHGLTPDGIAGPRTLAKLSTAATQRPASKGPSRRMRCTGPRASRC